jgi:flagellin
MRVSTNIGSMSAQKYVRQHTDERSLEDSKLSSGNRIVQSSVDPAGLAISEKMRSKIRSSYQAERNSNDSISLLQVAEGALSNMQDVGSRLRELAMQSANDTLGDAERAVIDLEFQHMKSEVERITASTSFNGNNIIKNGRSDYELQVGIDGTAQNDRLAYDMTRVMDVAGNFGIGNVNLKTKVSSQNSLEAIDKMMGQIGASRAELGSVNNRINSIIQNLQTSRENTESSNSKIRDTDYAKVTASNAMTKLSQQASLAMLKISNDNPAIILKLVS